MNKQNIIRKLTSRKFWAVIVMGCGCIAAGMGGYVDGTTSLQGAVMTVVAYLLAEGAPDFARLIANSTKTTITATSTDKATVAELLTPKEKTDAQA